MAQRVRIVLVAGAALLGFSFASVSTSDFVAHLDRQVHGIHCGFLPGFDAPDVSGTSGCHVALMSPYSSVFRDRIWGGIPISLPAMAVFAYLASFALALLPLGLTQSPQATGYLFAATGLPLLTSIGMAWISFRELGTVCKLCVGIYVSSALAFVFALAAFVHARRAARAGSLHRSGPKADPGESERRATSRRVDGEGWQRSCEPIDLGISADATAPAEPPGSSAGATFRERPPFADDAAGAPARVSATTERSGTPPLRLSTASEIDQERTKARARSGAERSPTLQFGWTAAIVSFVLGVVFVLVPVVAYAVGAPDFDRYVGSCGTLAHPEDPGRVLVALGPQTHSVQVIEILDPLCPACRAFERRFAALEASERVSRRALLFPLDHACNWMVDRALHPGACAVSEAMLCADDEAERVLAWAFENQEAIRAATERDPNAASRMVRQAFPHLAECLGRPEVRARLNRALRWAVANQLPVLTPQVYVNGLRICDADTDLGLDWALARLIERTGAESRAVGAGGAP
jgi:uncharacterized membrane protein